MTKIKYIHCFGTSHTAGGGFEFEGTNSERSVILKKLYSKVDSPLTQYNFSYPGQLQKFVSNDIKVYNHAKQGYGNDRMYRILHDITTQYNFNSDENIFLFEFTGIGRQELFLNEIDDYITINWQYNLDKNGDIANSGVNLLGVANSYHYESQSWYDFIKDAKHNSFFQTYVKFFVNFKKETKEILKNNEFFISYLDKLNLKYYYTSPIVVKNDLIFNDITKQIVFGDGDFFIQHNNMLDFATLNDLIINKETNGVYDDDHNSFKSNKLCAHIIYNKLVLDGLLDTKINPIDWKWYKEKLYLDTII